MNSLPDDLGPRLRNSVNRGTAPELSPDLITGAADRDAPKLTDPRRRIQLVGGGTALVAAIAVAAIVIVPSLGPSPLFTEAASSGASVSASGNVPAVGGLMRIWADYHYVAGPGLSTSGSSGDVYQLRRDGSGSDRIAELAGAFGLTGKPVRTDDSDAASPELTIGAVDGSTPALYLSWSGTGDWSYSDEDADPGVACPPTVDIGGASGGSTTGSSGGTTTSGSGTATTTPGCASTATPTGPDNAPTGADARAKAQKIFAATGLDVPASDIQLESDPAQTTATAYLSVGGVETALDWSVSWSSTGQIDQAFGHSVTVVDRGRYDTISASDAVQRLSDSRWYGSAGPAYQGGIRAFTMNNGVGHASGVTNGTRGSAGSAGDTPPVAAPTSTPTETPTVTPTATPTATPTVVPTVVPTPVPTDPSTNVPTAVPTPEPTPSGPPVITVTITDAQPTLLLMWASDGNAWLVPGYAMRVENGWWTSVVSLVPGVIALPPAPTVVPDSVEPVPATPGATASPAAP
jgi:hypothetical protein